MGKNRKVSDTVTERGVWVRIGVLPFYIKPMTLAQLYTIGATIQHISVPDWGEDEKINVVAEMLNRYRDAHLCSRFAVQMIFRSPIMRIVFGAYIRHNLTIDKYAQIIRFGTQSIDPAFFLTNITFLKGVKAVTKMTNIPSPTARGASLAE
jgi:hypothetical protein